jgi:acyl-CoA reductase-like NAD-dependent aldehyde dehydrogenase
MAAVQPIMAVRPARLTARPVVSPHDNTVIDEVANVDAATAERALDAATRDSSWAALTAPERAERLYAWADLVAANAHAIAALVSGESGKPIRQAREEAEGAAACVRYYAGLADKPIGEPAPQVFAGLNLVLREPVGTVVAIVPYNGPPWVTAHKSAGALAGGNNVVVKPSPLAARGALRLCALGLEAGIPETALQCIPGDAEVGRVLVASEKVQGLSFTGATETGRAVAEAAARTFKRVVLELGGKSPSVVFADADVAAAAASTVWGALAISGQDCCSRSRVLVEQSAYQEFVELLQAAVDRLVIGAPASEATDIGPLITRAHRDHVESFLTPESCGTGVRILGGGRPSDGGLEAGNYLAPAIVAGASPSSRTASAEIFGPIVAVMPFASDEEAIALANGTRYGLAASIWTGDVDRMLTVVARMDSGQVSVNSDSSVFMQLPFGGEKDSGLGRELGVRGMTNFLREKTVSIARRRP